MSLTDGALGFCRGLRPVSGPKLQARRSCVLPIGHVASIGGGGRGRPCNPVGPWHQAFGHEDGPIVYAELAQRQRDGLLS